MSLTPPSSQSSDRRYDLDWLRVIAFGLLIFYHVGMFYVTWGWHVKSAYMGETVEPLMLTINPWRLALLFFISGVAVRFATDKANNSAHFAASRIVRLGLPILFGMVVIVTPQTYFQLLQTDSIKPDYAAFYLRYLDFNPAWEVMTPTWNHLWYVVYLLVYILLITPIIPLLRQWSWGWVGEMLNRIAGHPARLILITPLPFIAYEYFLTPHYPTTHALFGDWANHAHRLTIFLLGYFAAKNPHFWRGVARAWPFALATAAGLWVFGTVMEASWPHLEDTIWGPPLALSEPALTVIYAWAAILGLLGLAQRFLNRSSPTLRYLTGAVFCYYILHQTITVSVGYWLTETTMLGGALEGAVLIMATLAGCATGYELVRRIPYLRIAFGIQER